MTNVTWNNTADVLPEPGVEVDTFSEGGIQQTLKYDKSGLWFVPDYKMYVYYVPKFWRPIQ